MTIQELITKVQDEKPNTFQNEKIIAFINEVEGAVAEELRVKHVIYSESDMDETLLAPYPYDRLYASFVKAMIDFANEEYASYQINQEQYNLDFAEFANWVVRTDHVQRDFSTPHRFKNVL